jgi:hypothetical protein
VSRTVKWVIGAALAILIAVFVVTGVSLVPVSVALGPCLRDLTSPSSYGTRASPLARVDARVGDGSVRVCYGRPSMHGRAIFGQLVPFDSLWRTGANEPTRLYTNRPIRLAGIPLAPGRYSLYSIPRPERWEVFVSRSILHWGNDLSRGVRAAEVGRTEVPAERLAVPVETLTIGTRPNGNGAVLYLDWETTRISLPLEAAH